ncbi:hypothetical protein [Nitrosomonas sp. Nm58]|uniref:hypothetical protein n=1 Tax=Nitrosomonas sp. Nm58 TaxID=200126 RepID=UPI00089D0488|nr:hypothetical protein [Nitrosomonas sp. Nm58]SDZ02589.1 hypothetical protein SAMN05421754_104415 [Nitrosomonas sp. Nm58]
MNIQCPNCRSIRITTKDEGRKVGGAIGAAGGGIHGIAGAVKGAKVGRTLGFIAGPAGGAFGSIAGAFFGGLIGTVTGGVTGAKLGEIVDQRILDNYLCRSCGHSFSVNHHFDHSAPIVDGPVNFNLTD